MTWRKRFAAKRFDGLDDEPRCGARRKIGDDKIADVVTETLGNGAFSRGALEHALNGEGVWPVSFDRASHRERILSAASSQRDIVGLYLDPPKCALVLCFDEKTRSQALGRTQPLLPMRPGQAERRTHDHERHGVTTLSAALDVKAGNDRRKMHTARPAQKFRKFLDEANQSA